MNGPGRDGEVSPALRRWLVAAAVYNIVWGGACVLAPEWMLSLLGVRPETDALWPELWACIGMIVGVYGVGYAIAARDPVRHWPIVLVGLLGKVFGPIGFVAAAVEGRLPWSMGVTILTNDLLWWIPFGMILWRAAKEAHALPDEDRAPLEVVLRESRDEHGVSLEDLAAERPVLLVLLRHTGCTFCRQTLADLGRWRERIAEAGVGLAVVGMSDSAASLRAFGERYGVSRAAWISDPERKLYRALEVGRGSFGQLFGLRVWTGGARAALEGHGIGRLEGDGFQMPGAFVIHRGRVVRAYRHRSAADRPDLLELACPN